MNCQINISEVSTEQLCALLARKARQLMADCGVSPADLDGAPLINSTQVRNEKIRAEYHAMRGDGVKHESAIYDLSVKYRPMKYQTVRAIIKHNR